MKQIKIFLLVSLISFSFTGCVGGPDMHTWNLESQRALNTNLRACINQRMKKSELMMQVGYPTYKEVVEDGEIWIYDIVDRGETTTTGYVAYSTFHATTSTPVSRSRVTIRFNKAGEMVAASSTGPARGAFRFLRPR